MAKKWFVLRVQSGKEDRVKENLEKQVKLADLEEAIPRVLVPTESITEMRGGKRAVSERKIYPGYIMVEIEVSPKLEMEEKAWFIIRETPGIGDFLGSKFRPVPMGEREVEKMLTDIEEKQAKPQLKIDFTLGESVKIKEGPFENFDGVVEEVSQTKGLVKVRVNIFGRTTPVELEYWQIEPI